MKGVFMKEKDVREMVDGANIKGREFSAEKLPSFVHSDASRTA
jgi:hypothetical protein